jgi:ABC-type nitrate/sulfonate/bicarbonate transport system permease component
VRSALHETSQRRYQGVQCIKNVALFPRITLIFNFTNAHNKRAAFLTLVFTILANTQQHFLKISNTKFQPKLGNNSESMYKKSYIP